MADSIDALYEGHHAEADLIDQPVYKCVHGSILVPRRALSGLVEHACPHCDLRKVTSFKEYMMTKGRGLVGVTCPQPRRGWLRNNLLGDAEMNRQLPNLTLHQIPQGHDVNSTIPVFGEIANRELAPIAGADHEIAKPIRQVV